MAGHSSRFLRRRAVVERQIIALLRGGSPGIAHSHDRRFQDLWRRDIGYFMLLASYARTCGLQILGPDALYVSADEIRLVRWLAHAQHKPDSISSKSHGELASPIGRCAEVLAHVGLRLPRTFMAAAQIDPDHFSPSPIPPVTEIYGASGRASRQWTIASRS